MDRIQNTIPVSDVEAVRSRIEEEFPLIHPDFSLRVAGRFFQNFEWDRKEKGGDPDVKVTFNFDNPEEVSGTPFVCKISRDLKSPNSFFGVAYGSKEEVEKIKNWSRKFKRVELLSYQGGQLIEKIV